MHEDALDHALEEAIGTLGLALPAQAVARIAAAARRALHETGILPDESVIEHCARATGEFMAAAYAQDADALGLACDPRLHRCAFLLGAVIGFQQAIRSRVRNLPRGIDAEWARLLGRLLGPATTLPEGFAPREFSHRALSSLEALWRDALGYRDGYRSRAPALELAELYQELLTSPPGARAARPAALFDTPMDALCYARSLAAGVSPDELAVHS